MPPVNLFESIHFINHLPKDSALCKQIWVKHCRQNTKVLFAGFDGFGLPNDYRIFGKLLQVSIGKQR
jgi:hypothetical protein